MRRMRRGTYTSHCNVFLYICCIYGTSLIPMFVNIPRNAFQSIAFETHKTKSSSSNFDMFR